MSAYHETKMHGTHAFPYVVYPVLLPDSSSGFPLHWHEEMEIIYVEGGSVSILVRNTEYIVKGGEFVLIHPQAIHAIRQHDYCRGFYFNILFRFSMLESGAEDICRKKYLDPIYNRQLLMPEYIDSSHPLNAQIAPLIRSLLMPEYFDSNHPLNAQIAPLFRSLLMPEYFDSRHPLNAQIVPLIRSLQYKREEKRFHNEMLIKSKLFEILYNILGYCEKADKKQAYEDIVFDKLKLSLKYLEENYAENITAESIAAVSNYSVSHFSKLFRQMTGESLTQYLKNYRLGTAASRLLNEPTKVSEIALSCGFSNLSYFSRAFYQKYNMTPSEFRKNNMAL